MEEGIEDYNLKPSAAKRIIDQAQAASSNGAQPDPRIVEKYRQTCMDVMGGGPVSDEGHKVLEDKRKRLNLTPEQAQSIKAEVLRQLGHAYIEEVK